MTVDETVLATNDTKAFAPQFTPSFGNDGQGATPVRYALSIPGGASGLTLCHGFAKAASRIWEAARKTARKTGTAVAPPRLPIPVSRV